MGRRILNFGPKPQPTPTPAKSPAHGKARSAARPRTRPVEAPGPRTDVHPPPAPSRASPSHGEAARHLPRAPSEAAASDPRRVALVEEIRRVDGLIEAAQQGERPAWTAIAALSRQRVGLAESLARVDAAYRP